MQRLVVLALIALGSCGDLTQPDGIVDAPADSPITVIAVPCPGTPAATITTTNMVYAFSPANVTITQGEVVQFTMSTEHYVEPGPTDIDLGLSVGFGENKCLRFTQPGTFRFRCGNHHFMGSVVVQ